MCHGQAHRYIGDKLILPLMTESLFMGPYKPHPGLGLMSLSPTRWAPTSYK